LLPPYPGLAFPKPSLNAGPLQEQEQVGRFINFARLRFVQEQDYQHNTHAVCQLQHHKATTVGINRIDAMNQINEMASN
jgi:hypothetical protein